METHATIVIVGETGSGADRKRTLPTLEPCSPCTRCAQPNGSDGSCKCRLTLRAFDTVVIQKPDSMWRALHCANVPSHALWEAVPIDYSRHVSSRQFRAHESTAGRHSAGAVSMHQDLVRRLLNAPRRRQDDADTAVSACRGVDGGRPPHSVHAAPAGGGDGRRRARGGGGGRAAGPRGRLLHPLRGGRHAGVLRITIKSRVGP